ncbi:MAG TPA: hypothetical protein VJ819_18240 [Nocardioidaceae bacterium]|jgi:hypothetical protein|nr:hypothetical protein [Nocardioidaceae bacterium]
MVMSLHTARARAAAVTMLLLGACFAVQIPRLTDVAPYLGVLIGAGVAAGVFAAVRLWFGGHMEGRVLALTLALAGLVGHGLNYAAGLPGASALEGNVSGASMLAIPLELATVVLLVLDAARRPALPARRHPYAL